MALLLGDVIIGYGITQGLSSDGNGHEVCDKGPYDQNVSFIVPTIEEDNENGAEDVEPGNEEIELDESISNGDDMVEDPPMQM